MTKAPNDQEAKQRSRLQRFGTIPITIALTTLTMMIAPRLQAYYKANSDKAIQFPPMNAPLKYETPVFPKSTRNRALEKQLQTRLNVSIKDQRPIKTLTWLAHQCELSIKVEESAREILASEDSITLHLNDVCAESVLSLILSVDPKLTYQLRRFRILITTIDQVTPVTKLGIYPVAPFQDRLRAYQDFHFNFLSNGNEDKEDSEPLDSLDCNALFVHNFYKATPPANLVNILRTFLDLPSDDHHWVRRIKQGIALLGKESHHQRCKQFLEALSQNAYSGQDVQVDLFTRTKDKAELSWQKKIEKKLRQKFERVHFPKATLTEHLLKFSELAGINIHISPDTEFDPNPSPITFNDCSAKTILSGLLHYHDLGFIPYKETLQIVPSDEVPSEAKLQLRIMNVEDILYQDIKHNSYFLEPSWFKNTLTELSGQFYGHEDMAFAIYGGQLIMVQSKAGFEAVDKILDAIRRDIKRRPKKH